MGAVAAANRSTSAAAAAATAASSNKGAACLPSTCGTGGGGEAPEVRPAVGVGAQASKPGHERVGRGRVGAKQQAIAAEAEVAAAANRAPAASPAAALEQERQRGARNGGRAAATAAAATTSGRVELGQQPQSPLPPQQRAGGGAKKSDRFPEYLPQEQLQAMFKRGLAFRGRFRVRCALRPTAGMAPKGVLRMLGSLMRLSVDTSALFSRWSNTAAMSHALCHIAVQRRQQGRGKGRGEALLGVGKGGDACSGAPRCTMTAWGEGGANEAGLPARTSRCSCLAGRGPACSSGPHPS